jgi:hypothetical protein
MCCGIAAVLEGYSPPKNKTASMASLSAHAGGYF